MELGTFLRPSRQLALASRSRFSALEVGLGVLASGRVLMGTCPPAVPLGPRHAQAPSRGLRVL